MVWYPDCSRILWYIMQLTNLGEPLDEGCDEGYPAGLSQTPPSHVSPQVQVCKGLFVYDNDFQPMQGWKGEGCNGEERDVMERRGM